MPVTLSSFNRGRISRLGLARVDIDRVKLSAEVQTNWVPRALGSMMLRPGLGYLAPTYNNAAVRMIPFVFQATDTALIEISSGAMRVWIDDAVVTRGTPLSTISNGDFSSSLTGWADADETGSTSYWSNSNALVLVGTRYARAKRRQQVVCSNGNHNVAIDVTSGSPIFKIGSSAGGDDLFGEFTMRPGNYSLTFETTGVSSYWVEVAANTEYPSIINSIQTESSGDMVIPTVFVSSDLDGLRWAQSNDVVFVAVSSGISQKRIERRGQKSWGVVDYTANDGPFRNVNTSLTRTAPSGLTGQISIVADRAVFSTDHVGALWKITSIGQSVEQTFTGPDQNSDYIRVSGVGDGRTFLYNLSIGGATEAIYLQRSVGEPGSWANVSALKFTANAASSYNDGLDNQIVFYRMFRPSTTSTDDTSSGDLTYSAGGITGIARITGYLGATETTAIVLKAFGSTGLSELWSEGDWSSFRGYPSAVALHEGRVFWGGRSKLWGSVSDAFESFDNDSTELGDAGPINLNIASGSNDQMAWLVSLSRLVMGTPLTASQAKTSSLEEPLTPTNFAIRDIATQGSAPVAAIKLDQRAIFVQASQSRVFEISLADSQLDYNTVDRTQLIPEMCEPSVVRAAAQRQPDTRVHFVRSDGTVAMLLSDPAENILCWLDIKSTAGNGAVEEIVTLPGNVEDSVYYVMRREINGSTVRYVEKWAKESEAHGAAANKMADSFVVQNSTSTTVVSGLDHLVGSSVVAWGATADLGSYTVSTTGTITLSQASTTTVVGLPYYGVYQSAKLAYATQDGGSGLTSRKKIDHLGLVLADTHAQGLQFGPSTSRLQNLPRIERMQTVSTNYVHTAYDNDPVVFPGSWDTDSRLVLYAAAPRPVTVLGCVIDAETRGKN